MAIVTNQSTQSVAVSRCPQSHICIGTSNIERVINHVEPCLLPSALTNEGLSTCPSWARNLCRTFAV